MQDTAQLTLPVLPLHSGVIFPHMVVTVSIETKEGKTALEASARSNGQLLIVPRFAPTSLACSSDMSAMSVASPL